VHKIVEPTNFTDMKKSILKLLSFALVGMMSFVNFSCNDTCKSIRTYRTNAPVTVLLKDLPKTIAIEAAKELEKPGKIYVKDNYLFITEEGKGIHVIDNLNPAKPTALSFIKVGGNGDMAIKDNLLYIDNYTDLVAMDITDPKSIKEAGRLSLAFVNSSISNFGGNHWYYNSQNQSITYYVDKIVTDTVDVNCGGYGYVPCRGCAYDSFSSSKQSSGAAGPTGVMGAAGPSAGTGTGGSMARFTIYDNYLYAVNNTSLLLYDIKNPTRPSYRTNVNLGWGIETVFPYKDKLFIGSQTGMFIFDNKTPENPQRLSTFNHARACDPVVVHDNIAYVTLRTGTGCGGALNQLLTVDVTDLKSPKLIRTFQMQNPHGLGVDFPSLFVCEGNFGLKSMDAKDPNNIFTVQQLDKIDSYDVIPLNGKHLIMVGKNGLYQYDYKDPKNLKQLSVIPIKTPNP
jgi:hypothetical protein